MDKKILICIDCENEFIDGSLAVNGAKDAMDKLVEYVREHYGDYEKIVCTSDFHPMDHCSFKEFGGKWPTHCIGGSNGAAIYTPLIDVIKEKCPKKFHLLLKGMSRNKDEYSCVDSAQNRSGLYTMFIENKIDAVDICGIALDVCVASSIDGMRKMEFLSGKISLLSDFSPSIGSKEEALKNIRENFKIFIK